MFTLTTVNTSATITGEHRLWALTLTHRECAPPEQLQNSPTVCHLLGSNLQNELSPDNSFLKFFPAHTYCELPRKSSCIHSGNSPRPLTASGLWAKAYQGHGFLHQLLGVQWRSANTSVNPEVPQTEPAPHQCQNNPLSVVLVSRQRFQWGRW